MTNPLICEHGQLRRQCQHCDDAREILELRDENCQLRQILCNVLTACGNGSGAIPQASLEFFATVPDEVAAVVMKMGSEIDALRADAMRYQWLRGNCECMGWGSRSDAAIDAAMGADGVTPTLPTDPCPQCRPGVICKTPKCGRLRSATPGVPERLTTDTERLCWALRQFVKLVPAGDECRLQLTVGTQSFFIGMESMPEDEAAHFAGLFVFALAGMVKQVTDGMNPNDGGRDGS